jgi:hypothetical protein
LIKPPDLSTAAPWKQRFNAPRFLLAYMARANPARGIIIGNQPMVAIADFALAYEDASDALKSFFAGLFGGTPEQKPEQYAASSPIAYAENVRADLHHTRQA